MLKNRINGYNYQEKRKEVKMGFSLKIIKEGLEDAH